MTLPSELTECIFRISKREHRAPDVLVLGPFDGAAEGISGFPEDRVDFGLRDWVDISSGWTVMCALGVGGLRGQYIGW